MHFNTYYRLLFTHLFSRKRSSIKRTKRSIFSTINKHITTTEIIDLMVHINTRETQTVILAPDSSRKNDAHIPWFGQGRDIQADILDKCSLKE